MKNFKRFSFLLAITVMVLFALAACNASPTSIVLDTEGAQTTFHIGETFSTEGLVVTAVFSDDTEQQVALTDCTFSSPDMSTAGQKDVTVTYHGVAAIYSITVTDESLPTYFQFTGRNDELASSFMVFVFLVILDNDGSGIVYQGQGSANGDSISVTEIPLTWSIEKDRDGIVTMSINIDGNEHIAYQEPDETFMITYNFKFVNNTYSRDVDLVGEAGVQFETIEDWQEYAIEQLVVVDPDPVETKETVYTFIADTDSVIVVSTNEPVENCGAEIILYDDGTVYARTGYAVDTIVYSTYTEYTGTWTTGAGNQLLITINSVEYTATIDDGIYSFTMDFVQEVEGAVTVFVHTVIAE